MAATCFRLWLLLLLLVLGQGGSRLLYPAATGLLVFQKCTLLSTAALLWTSFQTAQVSKSRWRHACSQNKGLALQRRKCLVLGANAGVVLALCESMWCSPNTPWVLLCRSGNLSTMQLWPHSQL